MSHRVHFDAHLDADLDDQSDVDERQIATLPTRVAESIRLKDHRLHENRAELMRLLRRSEERNLLATAQFQGALDSLTEELAAAHATISMLKQERDKLRTRVTESLHQIDLWESKATQEKDRATASLNCAEVERDRVAGLEALLAESHRRERQLATDLASTIAERQRIAIERDEAIRRAEKTERDIGQASKALTDARERVAAAEETAETLRLDRRAGASVLELNATLTRHVALAVKANQAMAEALLRFDGLRECVRPIPASAVAGLYEFDADKWSRRLDAEATTRLEAAPKQWSSDKVSAKSKLHRDGGGSRADAAATATAAGPARARPRLSSSNDEYTTTLSDDEEADRKQRAEQKRRAASSGRHAENDAARAATATSHSRGRSSADVAAGVEGDATQRKRSARRGAELVTTVKVTRHDGICTNHRHRSESASRRAARLGSDQTVPHAPTVHVEGPICDGCRAAVARGEVPDKHTKPSVPAPTSTAVGGKGKFRVCIHTPDRRTIVF